ncbi:hypothetical protein SMD22_00825 (plasmid) [Brevibacillus halotolerans]|nr:hypothetical protein SMD22_00825 [Brevibacillus halotolerans]
MFYRVSLDECQSVIQLFEEDNEGRVEAWVDMNRLFVKGNENGYEIIELESAMTREIKSFATKHGFKRKEDGFTPEIPVNWEVRIS